MTQRDWPEEIAKAVIIRQEMSDLDTGKIYQYPFPRVAATNAEIALIQTHLKEDLDEEYKGFLRFANGWPYFYQNVSLFGTPELLGREPGTAAQASLDVLESSGVLETISVDRRELLPFAASLEQEDIFLLCGRNSGRAGHVLWLAGELVEEFVSFDDYYDSMIDYLLEELEDFKADSNTAN